LGAGNPGTGNPPLGPPLSLSLCSEVFGLWSLPSLPPLLSPPEGLAKVFATTDDERIIAAINEIIIDVNAIFDIYLSSSCVLLYFPLACLLLNTTLNDTMMPDK
jgi:hypothetical protein